MPKAHAHSWIPKTLKIRICFLSFNNTLTRVHLKTQVSAPLDYADFQPSALQCPCFSQNTLDIVSSIYLSQIWFSSSCPMKDTFLNLALERTSNFSKLASVQLSMSHWITIPTTIRSMHIFNCNILMLTQSCFLRQDPTVETSTAGFIRNNCYIPTSFTAINKINAVNGLGKEWQYYIN